MVSVFIQIWIIGASWAQPVGECYSIIKMLKSYQDPTIALPPTRDGFRKAELRLNNLHAKRPTSVLETARALGFPEQDFQIDSLAIDLSKPHIHLVNGNSRNDEGVLLKFSPILINEGHLGTFGISESFEPLISVQELSPLQARFGNRSPAVQIGGAPISFDFAEQKMARGILHEFVHCDSCSSPWDLYLLHHEMQLKKALANGDRMAVKYLEDLETKPEHLTALFLNELHARAYAPNIDNPAEAGLKDAWDRMLHSFFSRDSNFRIRVLEAQNLFDRVVNKVSVGEYPLGDVDEAVRWFHRFH